ncbi:MAG: hypothetical protein HQL24_02860 [Candidatus Omnitrophica bacterium]|nr:hypothetical protein [Candidatus Omnitrophota bacterium]
MADDIKNIEQEAQKLFEAQKYEEASKLFLQAAMSYQSQGQHKQATICFTSAASCCEFQGGRQTLFYYASMYYEKAAEEAVISGDYEYASILYKNAGICYERDLEYVSFSECFFLSKECYRKSLMPHLFYAKRLHHVGKNHQGFDLKGRMKLFISWVLLSISSILWGHGERPQRTVIFACSLILLTALLYTQGHFLVSSVAHKPNLFESIYFSLITFTHIGYGDIIPIGFNKIVAILEEFVGIFIIPLFLTGLCRKYLRFL